MSSGDAASKRSRGWRALDHRQRLTLVSALAANALLFFDQTAVAVALRAIHVDFGGTSADLQWVISAYLLALAVFMVFAGRLADHVGRKRLFLIGVAVFGLSSLACAVAPALGWLIGARFVQGMGAAILQPLALAIVTSAVDATERGWSVGVLSAGGTSFLTIGPLVAGGMLAFVSWRWLFIINLPIVILSAVIGWKAIDESRVLDPAPLDWLGVSILLVGLFAFVLGITEASDWGEAAWVSASVGAALLVVFVVQQQRSSHPLVHFDMFRNRSLSTSVLALFIIQFVVLGTTVFLATFLNHGLGKSAFVTGTVLAAGGIFTPLLSITTGRLTDEWGPRRLVAPGLALTAIGMLAMGLASTTAAIALLLPGLLIYSLSRPAVFTPASVGPLGALPDEDRALASSLVTESRQLGAVLGVAVMGAVFAAVRGTNLTATAVTIEDGFRAAMFCGAALAAAGAVIVRLAMPARA